MAKIKVTKFNFSGEMLEKAKSENPLLGVLARMASETREDGCVPCQQTMWIDTDKVVAVGEVVKAKEGAGIPDIYQVFFSHGDKPNGWDILADTYDEFMAAWTGEITATFNREPGNLVEQFRKEVNETKEAIERGDYKEPAGMGPARVLTGVGDKVVEDVDGTTVERIRITFPSGDISDYEKEYIRVSVVNHADELLSTRGTRDLAAQLQKEWMAEFYNRYGGRLTDVYIIPREDGMIEVQFLVR